MSRAEAPRSGLRQGLTVLTLGGTIFIFISSGPFGLEAMVREGGPGIAPLMLVVALLFWGLSHSLVASELSSAIPVEGGFFRWIGMAFGEFWGFQSAWWYWIKMLCDTAIYPILFSEYLKFWYPEMETWQTRTVRVVLIWTFVIINLLGIRTGGRLAVLLTIFILAPFVMFVFLGVPFLSLEAYWPFATEGKNVSDAMGFGLLFGLWCYNTLDSVSIVAGEVEAPRKTYVRAYALAVPLILLTYLIPILIGVSVDPNTAGWSDFHFTALGFQLGGVWLGSWLAVAALASNVAIFHGALMVNTRVPMVLADRKQFFTVFSKLSARSGVPWVALLFDGVVYTIVALAVDKFSDIVRGIQWFNMGIYTLLYLSFLKLRWQRPDLPRPFRIPGGWPGALAVCTGPFIICWVGIPYSAREFVVFGALALASGPLAWWFLRRVLRHDPQSTPPSSGVADAAL